MNIRYHMMMLASMIITAHSVFSMEDEEKMKKYLTAGFSEQKQEEINQRFKELPKQQQNEFWKEYSQASLGMLFPGPPILAMKYFLKKQSETVEVK